MDQLRRDQDSVGAKITVIAEGVPVGLGEPVFDRLDADLAHALMGINAVKGVEIGDGFGVVASRGSEHRDEMTPEGFLSNHAGGVLGGISTGQPLVAHLALKPTSSITQPGRSIDVDGAPVEVITKGRHDPCVGIRHLGHADRTRRPGARQRLRDHRLLHQRHAHPRHQQQLRQRLHPLGHLPHLRGELAQCLHQV